MTKNRLFSAKTTLNLGGELVELTPPLIMGILNVTPDSFFRGSRFRDTTNLLKKAEAMMLEGADLLDIGGYSTRPGAEDVALEEELHRVVPAVEAISRELAGCKISVDTFRAEVASQACQAGAVMVNDISGGTLDDQMFPTIAKLGVSYVLMHIKGDPQTMSGLSQYKNLEKEILDFFQQQIQKLREWQVRDVVIDPGFGFAKTVQQNFQLLNCLHYFKILELPILVGVSRKSMIWKTLGTDAGGALNGTTALNTIALLNGASILRVHDVREAVETRKLVGTTLGKW